MSAYLPTCKQVSMRTIVFVCVHECIRPFHQKAPGTVQTFGSIHINHQPERRFCISLRQAGSARGKRFTKSFGA
ncbi:unnamed protein product [Protopolystoma xenopodis]|uniref:Uncharacterized protein n=1 Tax=Protopolystoma xenopodis TaxID=117903 RepID=A0A3S5AU93_9PLAT|nr:unnamed protein product [Protopolystoma xenopodis]